MVQGTLNSALWQTGRTWKVFFFKNVKHQPTSNKPKHTSLGILHHAQDLIWASIRLTGLMGYRAEVTMESLELVMSSAPLFKQVIEWLWYYSGCATKGCILSLAILNKSYSKQCWCKWKQQLQWWHHKYQLLKNSTMGGIELYLHTGGGKPPKTPCSFFCSIKEWKMEIQSIIFPISGHNIQYICMWVCNSWGWSCTSGSSHHLPCPECL